MSIWGKVIGGVAGFAVGGPFGALLGAAAGHAVDRMRETVPGADQQIDPNDVEARQIAFTMAVIVLGAKLAKVDGKVTKDEVAAFKRVFSVPANESGDVGKLFNEAKQDARGFEPYARQIALIFSHDKVMLEDLMGALFHIANADGEYHPAERDFLAKVAIIFGFGRQDFERLEDTYIKGEDADDPYEILGVPTDATDNVIKDEYRKLIRENHPDTMMAKGLPQEFIDLANEKMATINAAYDRICKQRGIK